ncbi:uncharacterized protein [Fopius arisanus]|uniref:KTR4 protein n=1 Tax=Fopius arisanus TaxID=64838 RepID=A0A0C9PRZ5_9HYME|nr:PREDICTED: uncharacterized protein LOC105272108 [Fopius arisanus]XP_011312315.1 PREDICTED: uncharacterized protein LOC105272108 [Fopius arisanus]
MASAADKLHYDNYAFSTDRESSVERIFTEENRLSTSKKLTKKSVHEELTDASFDMVSNSIDRNKENELDSCAKTSIENTGSSKKQSESPRRENFALFDAEILEDKEYRQRIKNRIKHMIPRERNYDTHHLSTILRVYLKKELVLSTFTSVRAKNEKVPLKDTHFYKCLLSVHTRVLGENMSEQKFRVHLKASLNSAKDWDGGRAFRRG